MHTMFECIFGIEHVVPIDYSYVDFGEIIITRLFLYVFFRSYSFPCRSLLLSATVLNDVTVRTYTVHTSYNLNATRVAHTRATRVITKNGRTSGM